MSRKFATFNIPGDLEALTAFGVIRKLGQTGERKLDDLIRHVDRWRKWKKALDDSYKGGKAKLGRLKADTLEIIAFVEADHTYGEAAIKFELTRDAVAKRVQRARRRDGGG